MEEPLLGTNQQAALQRFTGIRIAAALFQLLPGLALCALVVFSAEDCLSVSYRCWFSYCCAVLILVGALDLFVVLIARFQCLKSIQHIVGMASLCVGCLLPIPLLILMILGMQMDADSGLPQVTRIVTLCILGVVFAGTVLCSWKKGCLMIAGCCNICGTERVTKASDAPAV